MRMFRWCDLHCDTLSRCLDRGEGLFRNGGQLDLARGNRAGGEWTQVFACWLDDRIRGEAAFERFLAQRRLLLEEIARRPREISLWSEGPSRPGRCRAILAVEGGQVLAGKLENVEALARLGVRFLTLVWNGGNELGQSALPGEGGGPARGEGLTHFGRKCIPELERFGIVADISHLNDKGIGDVFALARRPVTATHSNLRTICGSPRNLTEAQFVELARRKGLCGLNFYPPFVCGGNDYPPEALRRHLERMLELGGENIVALGSDFDGARMPSFLKGVESLYSLYELVIKWVGESIARKLFYENAGGFLENNRPAWAG